MARRKQPSLRSVLKAQREYRAVEAQRHIEDLAIWIGKRGPIGSELADRVGLPKR